MNVVFQLWIKILLLVCFLALQACASNKAAPSADEEPITGDSIGVNPDPWEGFNRGVFTFNDTLDGWILKPVAKGYRWVTPDPVETGVNNFFSNLGEVGNVLNNMLQWKWKKVGTSTGRFLMNSTVGVAGLFDVAKHTGLKKQDAEDFGQTLSTWGVGAGPYLVLPFLGPSTVTDAVSLPVDWYSNPLIYTNLEDDVILGISALGLVSTRANLLDAEKLMSGDKYTFIREAYLQYRDYQVSDGAVDDSFGGDSDDFEEFDEDF